MPRGKVTCPELSGSLDELLTREWLLTDGMGGFAAATVIGCPTRRYHGLLVAPKRPPLERFLLLAGTLDRVVVESVTFDLSTYEFNGVLHPTGYRLLTGFALDTAQPEPWVEFRFCHEAFEARKRITMCSGHRAVRLNFEVTAKSAQAVTLQVSPLVALRDFHGFRRITETDPWHFYSEDDAAWFHSREDGEVTLAVLATDGRTRWRPQPVWWKAFRYRQEIERGFLEHEDLLNAGAFRADGVGTLSCELTAVGLADCLPTARRVAEHRPKRRRTSAAVCRSLRDDPVASRLAEIVFT